jgi:hypothetical protein
MPVRHRFVGFIVRVFSGLEPYRCFTSAVHPTRLADFPVEVVEDIFVFSQLRNLASDDVSFAPGFLSCFQAGFRNWKWRRAAIVNLLSVAPLVDVVTADVVAAAPGFRVTAVVFAVGYVPG